MDYVQHGGQCCGVSHVYGFDRSTIADLDAILRRHDTRNDHGAPGNRLLEAILSQRQVDPSLDCPLMSREVREAGGWARVLLARGFRLVSRFENSNSGRNCYIYHRVATPTTGDLPYVDEPAAVAAPAPAPAVGLPIVIPADWQDHPDDIIEFHDGTPMTITRVGHRELTAHLRGVPRTLPSGHQIQGRAEYTYVLASGEWAGRRGQAIRMRQVQAPAQAVEEGPAAPAPDENNWRPLTVEDVPNLRPGQILRYDRPGVGRVREWLGREMPFVRVVRYTVRGQPVLMVRNPIYDRDDTIVYDRFSVRPADMAVPAPEPEPEVLSTEVFCLFAGNRRGTQAFQTIADAQARWPRCRRHVIVRTFDDGSTEEEIVNAAQ